VKRLAQMCGHGDPGVNQEYLHASLRVGRDRIQNGIRCATSAASAEALAEALGQDTALELAQQPSETWPPPRSLGVEESERMLECSMVAVAVARDAGLSLARVLRELHSAASEQGLHIVALHASDAQGTAPLAGASGGSATAAWLCKPGPCEEQLARWREARPAAGTVVDLAGTSGRLLLATCEGPVGCERARRAMAAVSAAVPRGSLEWYSSATAGEAVADVACFFRELRGAKHYVVDSDG